MRPDGLLSQLFLDSGDPKETKEVIALLGFLDGQTTNPTLIAKNPEAQERLNRGKKFLKEEVYDFYQDVVREISQLIPNGSVSIEVHADANTTAKEMIEQSEKMYTWIPNAHIKLPITKSGLEAAEILSKQGVRLNMTLCFSQQQAAAVYAATRGAKRGSVYISPFVGRLDDIGLNGTQFVQNVVTMYQQGNSHVEVLSASIRSLTHFQNSMHLPADIITSPASILKDWAKAGFLQPSGTLHLESEALKPVPFEEINLSKPWQEYNIQHDLTDKGLQRFVEDWNKLID
ncbi:MAG: transaldolase family protein [bacterium]